MYVCIYLILGLIVSNAICVFLNVVSGKQINGRNIVHVLVIVVAGTLNTLRRTAQRCRACGQVEYFTLHFSIICDYFHLSGCIVKSKVKSEKER